jgi:hypothetical protein
MQLFLASILSGTALLVGFLAQTDWKPYSSPERCVVALMDDFRSDMVLADIGPGRQFTHTIDGSPRELQVSRTERDAAYAPSDSAFNRTQDVALRQKERNLLTDSAGLIARNNGHTLVITDPTGHAFNLKFDFDEGSFEMLADGGSKDKRVKVKKFFSSFNIAEMAERELRNELRRSQREARAECREAKRDAEDAVIHVEPVEPRRVQQNEYIRFDRSNQ